MSYRDRQDDVIREQISDDIQRRMAEMGTTPASVRQMFEAARRRAELVEAAHRRVQQGEDAVDARQLAYAAAASSRSRPKPFGQDKSAFNETQVNRMLLKEGNPEALRFMECLHYAFGRLGLDSPASGDWTYHVNGGAPVERGVLYQVQVTRPARVAIELLIDEGVLLRWASDRQPTRKSKTSVPFAVLPPETPETRANRCLTLED